MDSKIEAFLETKTMREFEYGHGDGYGRGDGSGHGYGYGYGDGHGYGYGRGDGSGNGFIKINDYSIYNVDGIPTIFYQIRGNVAKGARLRCDMTLKECCIVKRDNLFAHGDTLRDAVGAVEDKYLATINVEERLEKFKAIHNPDEKYPAEKFFRWHGILTGSCELGRKDFVESKGIDMQDMFTVAEFVDICKDSYGGDIISRLM